MQRGNLFCRIAVVATGVVCCYGQSFDEAQSLLKTYCQSCHSQKSPAAGFSVTQLGAPASLSDQTDKWARVAFRVRNSEMPPLGAPAPTADQREVFAKFVDESLHARACSAGPVPGRSPIRRLNRDEYTSTVRELLDIHVDVGHDLPADGAGGQGFDNAAEVLFLSPVLAEKYMDAAKQSLEFAMRDSRARQRIGIVEPAGGVTPSQAAQKTLREFLPRAFRRPVATAEMEPFLALFREAQREHLSFDNSLAFMLRGVLMSPQFVFRVEAPNSGAVARPVDDYALASRLSYFLWDSMPDEMLFDLASMGKLHEPAVLKEE